MMEISKDDARIHEQVGGHLRYAPKVCHFHIKIESRIVNKITICNLLQMFHQFMWNSETDLYYAVKFDNLCNQAHKYNYRYKIESVHRLFLTSYHSVVSIKSSYLNIN
jgi:hypothetical protein